MSSTLTLRALLAGGAGAALLLIAGCQTVAGGSCHKPQAYQAAEDLQPLRVPDGLTAPDTDDAMQVPPLTTPAATVDPDGPCLDAPPAITAPPLPPSGVVDPPPRRPGSRRGEDSEAETAPVPETSAPPAPEPERRRRRPTLPR